VSVLNGGLWVVDGAWSDDDDEAIVTLLDDLNGLVSSGLDGDKGCGGLCLLADIPFFTLFSC
jgi:hypothetical protein